MALEFIRSSLSCFFPTDTIDQSTFEHVDGRWRLTCTGEDLAKNIKLYPNVEVICLLSGKINDKSIQSLNDLDDLKGVYIDKDCEGVTNSTIGAISTLSKLRFLNIPFVPENEKFEQLTDLAALKITEAETPLETIRRLVDNHPKLTSLVVKVTEKLFLWEEIDSFEPHERKELSIKVYCPYNPSVPLIQRVEKCSKARAEIMVKSAPIDLNKNDVYRYYQVSWNRQKEAIDIQKDGIIYGLRREEISFYN